MWIKRKHIMATGNNIIVCSHTSILYVDKRPTLRCDSCHNNMFKKDLSYYPLLLCSFLVGFTMMIINYYYLLYLLLQ